MVVLCRARSLLHHCILLFAHAHMSKRVQAMRSAHLSIVLCRASNTPALSPSPSPPAGRVDVYTELVVARRSPRSRDRTCVQERPGALRPDSQGVDAEVRHVSMLERASRWNQHGDCRLQRLSSSWSFLILKSAIACMQCVTPACPAFSFEHRVCSANRLCYRTRTIRVVSVAAGWWS